MKKEDIITLPNQNLRKKCERVHVITDEVRQIVQDMIDASLDWENAHPHEISAAIAAPQINNFAHFLRLKNWNIEFLADFFYFWCLEFLSATFF